MQNFDEDMGELFLKASTEIRLRFLEDDWDKIKNGLVPDPVLLPAAESRVNTQNYYREVVIAFLLIGILTVSSIVFRDHNVNKMISVIQSGHNQTAGSGNKPALTYEKRAQKKPGHVIKSSKSFTTVPAEDVVSNNRFESNHLIKLTPVSREWFIHVDFDRTIFPQNIIANPVEQPKEKKEGKGIYVGIIAGPQISQTKQQGFGNSGISAGLVAGFHLNKRISIETGLVISNKQFSSSGEYFDMSKISASMPSGMKLLQIHSKSTVLEIPLDLNYELFKLKKGRLFAAGGLSSYVITSEHNQYQASVNGINEMISGNYSGNQSYFAAAAKVGAGYEWNAGHGLNLRVNPYVLIPLKTIGMGSMPVVSAGIYLGVLFPIIK